MSQEIAHKDLIISDLDIFEGDLKVSWGEVPEGYEVVQFRDFATNCNIIRLRRIESGKTPGVT